MIQNQNSKCIYCSHDLEITCGNKTLAQVSIDRKDSSKIYSKDNICISCLFCNLAKNDMDESIYKNFIASLRGQTYDFDHIENKNILSKKVGDSRVFDKKKNFNLDDTITTNQAKELLIKQNNRCAMSGLEFINSKGSRSPWKVSIDRIDNNKGHTLENSQLILISINYGKSINTNDDTIKYVKEIMES